MKNRDIDKLIAVKVLGWWKQVSPDNKQKWVEPSKRMYASIPRFSMEIAKETECVRI